MRYFKTLPSIVGVDSSNNLYTAKNIVARAVLQPKLSRNPMIFYKYTIQDGDTPESIAYKYYGDVYRYWLVLIANNIMDAQYEWPLDPQQMEKYLLDKYKSQAAEYYNVSVDVVTSSQIFAYINGTPHHYEKTITNIDNSTTTKSQKVVTIDEETYNSLIETNNTYQLPSGETCTEIITKAAISIYDYEFQINEDKRQINLIQDKYASQVESMFEKLMSK